MDLRVRNTSADVYRTQTRASCSTCDLDKRMLLKERNAVSVRLPVVSTISSLLIDSTVCVCSDLMKVIFF